MKLTRSRILWLVITLALAGIAMVSSWVIVDTTIHYTSDDEFCSSCHSHQPIGSSYRASLHGGNNPTGWRASCSDCHIPHDNAVHYIWVKAIHGVVDPTMEILKDPYDIDWHGHREKRNNYVYDSGCLSCHKYLESRTEGNPKAFLPHRQYFQQSDSPQCVECHQHVGHDELGHHLEDFGWKKPDGVTP